MNRYSAFGLLRGALNGFFKAHPDAMPFQNFIMAEVAELIRTDADGVIEPWDKLLEKGLKRFDEKFRDKIKAEASAEAAPNDTARAFVEGAANRQLPDGPSSFTRDQIAAMSMDEFLKNEAAINEALRNKRIR